MEESKFNCLLKASFKTDGLSFSEILVKDGKILAIRTKKIKSGRILKGAKALEDFTIAENCTVEFHLVKPNEFERILNSFLIQKSPLNL